MLRRVFERGAYTDLALVTESRGLDARDRALAMRLAYGTVQRRDTLDHLVGLFSDRPPDRLDPHLLAALRLALYELCYLHGAPDHAVVDDAVTLARGGGRAGHGLVNAVLRRAVREDALGIVEALPDTTPEQAALRHSHPGWIARMWWDMLGADATRALMAADNEPSELALRANTLLTSAGELAQELGVRSRLDPAIPEALVLEEAFDVHGSPQWSGGELLAQSRAAMLVSRVLGPARGERVLDLCAAPGGKSTHLAALMGGSGEVVAVERDPRRAAALERTARRMRARNVRVETADAERPRPVGESFDRVLVDPPCSGLGTLQARPDLRWRIDPGRVAEMAAAQARILAAAARAVRPGGVLVYSTCTISSTENERLIAAFLDSHADFGIDDLAAELPAWALGRAMPARGMPGARCLLTLPHRDSTAGFFIARMRRA